jgi:hypothetical protein
MRLILKAQAKRDIDMARVFVNGWGIVMALDHSETQILVNALSIGTDGSAILAGGAGLKAAKVMAKLSPDDPLPPWFGVATLLAMVAAYLQLEQGICAAVDGGNGVDLTLPWEAIPWGWFWFIIPTGRSPLGLGPEIDWTSGAFYGKHGTFFADVNGDGKADAIAVNDDGIYVRPSFGTSFPSPAARWATGVCYGTRTIGAPAATLPAMTFFADVNKDGMADAIVVNEEGVFVWISTGVASPGFLAPTTNWTRGAFYGTHGTFFADVNGDGMADAIAVNDDGAYVRLCTGSGLMGFIEPSKWTSDTPSFFADVDGDGKSDAIIVKDNGIFVRLSTGSSFGPAVQWADSSALGELYTLFADLGGGGKADLIAVQKDGVYVRASTGSGFGPAVQLTNSAFNGLRGTYFADVNGDGCADAIKVDDDTVRVRCSTG